MQVKEKQVYEGERSTTEQRETNAAKLIRGADFWANSECREPLGIKAIGFDSSENRGLFALRSTQKRVGRANLAHKLSHADSVLGDVSKSYSDLKVLGRIEINLTSFSDASVVAHSVLNGR